MELYSNGFLRHKRHGNAACQHEKQKSNPQTVIAESRHEEIPSRQKDENGGDNHRVADGACCRGANVDAVPDEGGKSDNWNDYHVDMIRPRLFDDFRLVGNETDEGVGEEPI